MPGAAPLDVLPLWSLFVLLLIGTLALEEAGFRIGRTRVAGGRAESDATVGAVVAAVLALLGFLVAFSFGIVAARFDSRRHLVLEEANAIGTTFLRAEMLPNPQAQSIRHLLRDYTEVRLGAASGVSTDQIVRRSEEIHRALWSETVAATAHDRSVPTGLFIQSLNELIDLHTTRGMVSLRYRMSWKTSRMKNRSVSKVTS